MVVLNQVLWFFVIEISKLGNSVNQFTVEEVSSEQFWLWKENWKVIGKEHTNSLNYQSGNNNRAPKLFWWGNKF